MLKVGVSWALRHSEGLVKCEEVRVGELKPTLSPGGPFGPFVVYG